MKTMKKIKTPSAVELQKIKDMAIDALEAFTPYELELRYDLSALEIAVAITMHRLADTDNCNPCEFMPDFLTNVANYIEQLNLMTQEQGLNK